MTDTAKAGMLCPVCRVDLMMTDRQGVEIDYCPRCRGVWLDRGELDKIVERSAAFESPPQAPDQRVSDRHDYRRTDERDRRDRPRKKKSLLQDLFDF